MFQETAMSTFSFEPARRAGSAAVLLGAALFWGGAGAASAMTMAACGTAYRDAKQAGTLDGQDWTAFRAAHCPVTLAATPSSTAPGAPAPVTAPATPGVPVTPAVSSPAAVKPPAQAGSPVFPSKIDPKYASLKPGRGRMKTCDDQYKANKATGGNAGLSWVQKGGGYYSACSKHLKAS
jgi:hypothetical protein